MGSLIFLRHGQAKNNTERILAGRTGGIPLTENGVRQAEMIARFLEPMNISKIYASPIERAHKTAQIVARHNSLECKVDERLVELDVGNFTGMKYDDICARHGNVFLKFYEENGDLDQNAIETFSAVKKRVQEISKDVIDSHPGENVVLVTHMDPIKAMVSSVMNLDSRSLFELIIANASLTIFKVHEGNLSLGAINVMDPTRFEQDW